MNRQSVILSFVVACLALCACDNAASPTYGLDQEFTLAPGEAAMIAGPDIRIRFVGVEGDSRCPADAFCIQGGDALVKIAVKSPGGPEQPYDLHTGSLEPVTHDQLTIALVQLQPYPFGSRTIAPGDYRATLRVS